MFLQLVMAPTPAQVRSNADSLFLYHPLQISALAETFWRNRYNAWSQANGANTPFVAWPANATDALLNDPSYILGYDPITQLPNTNGGSSTGSLFLPSGEAFQLPAAQPGIVTPGTANLDHLIYAYLVENTKIFDVFSKVLETYIFTEQLPSPSFAAQQFLRNTEYLLFSDGLPTMVWTTSSRQRHDEIANRMTLYYWMFGIDLSHAGELAPHHPYVRPDAANRDFIPTFEALASEVWKGIENAKNISGVNGTDNEAIATAARRLFDMMATRQLNGNLTREAFRAVSVMSWLHLAVMYDSAIVLALNASASSPEQRLQKIAERVGMSIHPKAKPLFDLASPFSSLMQQIETGLLNDAGNVAPLYTPPSTIATNAETVIDQYSLATGRDLKAPSVTLTQRAGTMRLPAPSHPAHSAHLAHAHPAAAHLPAPSPHGPAGAPHHMNGHAP
ncbi:MAG: hypothetical protein WB697_11755 [Stellaceae bacterium]